MKDKIKRNTFLSNDDDVNHFSPNYFKNNRWHDPKVEVMHNAFRAANDYYKKLSIQHTLIFFFIRNSVRTVPTYPAPPTNKTSFNIK